MNSISSNNLNQTPVSASLVASTIGVVQMQKYGLSSQTGPGFNPPLSIDFVCKLKRPSNLPNSLEYTNNQVFQGSVLEDWLMQSLDDHLNNQQQFYNARNSLLTVFY